jgi:hypothetical protein
MYERQVLDGKMPRTELGMICRAGGADLEILRVRAVQIMRHGHGPKVDPYRYKSTVSHYASGPRTSSPRLLRAVPRSSSQACPSPPC